MNRSDNSNYDVIVVGAGPGGVPAAIAASRNGARVLLVERYGFLGGMATAGLVNPFMSFRTGQQQVVQGLFAELLDKMEQAGAIARDQQHFDAEALKWILDEWVSAADVKLLLHSQLSAVRSENGKIREIEITHKGGTSHFRADYFIDATGDGDLAARSGAEFEIGRKADGACQPMTICFRMANVAIDRIPSHTDLNQLYEAAKANGEIENPRENVLYFHTPNPGVIHFNTTRILGKSALDAADLTEAEIIGRQQVKQMVHFLKNKIPGFENAYLMKIAPQMGIRESRRISGHYQMTAEDILRAAKFKDGIACGAYDIDIHNPGGTGTVIKKLAPGTWYQIPFRSLIPTKLTNCLIGSRCISTTHEAHASIRIMPIVAAIGEAAGTAAALCCQSKVSPLELKTQHLQQQLILQGAFL